ncbi:GumC family protein [Fervidobacterium gondwanense]|uniref:GumC family protein n=1 Tax=Fervidobacterium gondwanense TaxID=44754 RepID=UPI003C71DA64
MQQNTQMQEEITLHDIFQILKRRMKFMAIIFLVTVFATGLYLLITKPVYEVLATIRIPKSSSIPSLSGTAAMLLGGSVSSPAIDEQIEIIKSRKVLGSVVEELKLIDYFSKDGKEKLTINQVVSALAKDVITVTSKKNTSLIEIKASLKDKEVAYNLVKSIIDNYIKYSKELNKDENSYLFDFIENQLPVVEKELAEIEQRVEEFQKTKSVAPTQELEALMKNFATIQTNIVDTELQLKGVETQISAIEKNIAEIKGLIGKDSYTPNSLKLQELRKELVGLEVQYSTLRVKYTEDADPVREVKKQIETVRKMISDEISRILSSKVDSEDPVLAELFKNLITLQSEKESLSATLRGLELVKETLDEEVKKFPEIQREYVSLQRDYTIKQQTYSLLKAKYEELRLSTAGMSFNVPLVVDEPYIPEKPAKPNKKLTLAIGGVLGIFLGILGAFIKEATDKTLHSEEQIRFITGNAQVFGRIPTLKIELPVLSNPAFEQSEPFKLAALNIQSLQNSPKVIAITSPDKEDGKSVIASNLALSYSKIGTRTLLIDLNLRNPKIDEIFKLNQSAGLADVVTKKLPFENAVVRQTENLDILTVGNISTDPTTIISSAKITELIEEAKNRYEKIIIDTPSVNGYSDTALISKYADTVLLVIRLSKTQRDKLNFVYETPAVSSKISGIIINETSK